MRTTQSHVPSSCRLVLAVVVAAGCGTVDGAQPPKPPAAKHLWPIYDIPRLDKIVIDGKADDWDSAASAKADGGFRVDVLISATGKAKPVADHDARARLGWDDRGLLLLITVRDDRWVEHPDAGWLWRYDGVEVFLAPTRGDKSMCQWVVSPGMAAKFKRPRWKLHDHRKGTKRGKAPAALSVARRKTKSGYVLELSAPWAALGIRPKVGREIGFQLYVNDADMVDGETSHAVWYPADNTGADSNNMHRLRLAERPSPAVLTAGRWEFVWPAASRADVFTPASAVGRELIVKDGAKVLSRGSVKASDGRGLATLHMPIALTDPNTSAAATYLGGTKTQRIIVPPTVRGRAISRVDLEAIRRGILTGEFRKPGRKTGLLFGADRIPALRKRAQATKGMLDRLRKRCQALLATSPEAVDRDSFGPITNHGGKALEALTMAEGCLLLGNRAYAKWVKRRVLALLTVDTWVAMVHRPHCPDFDHVVGNIAARIALSHDYLGEAYSERETRQLADGLRKKFLLPYLKAVRGRNAWWSRREVISDWKIMTNGEAGLALCEFGRYWPEAREAMAHAALGVAELLDTVPPEGDYHQGVNYWFGTLYYGLRYVTALRRVTGGAVDLYRHPALKKTGDFAVMLTTPGKRAYNFEYNNDTMNARASAAVAMLATEARRKDWMYIARCFPAQTVDYLAFTDPKIASAKPTMTEVHYRDTGVAIMRSGWEDDATYVGIKCSPSFVPDKRFSGQLDAASFVIEAGGRWLAIDQGKWRYARYIGSTEPPHMYHLDSISSVGHNTLLIDGIGQTFGEKYPGKILSFRKGPGWIMVVADASQCYPGLLTKFVRTLLSVKPDVVIVRDVVECKGERHAEWLVNYAGKARRNGVGAVIENGGASLAVTPFLPSRKFGWRVHNVERTSIYGDDETRREIVKTIRQLRFTPFRKAEGFEFLFGLRVAGRPDGKDWTFQPTKAGWTLKAKGHKIVVRPKGDTLSVE